MTPSAHPSLILMLGIGALVVFRTYQRVASMVGRQHFRPLRSWSALVFFPLLALVLIAALARYPLSLGAELAGIAVGVGLAIYGFRLTKLEATAQGLYYTPNAHIGIVLSMLLTLRVVYRLVVLNYSPDVLGNSHRAFMQAPLTLVIVGTLAGYYSAYAFGLIRWSRAVSRTA